MSQQYNPSIVICVIIPVFLSLLDFPLTQTLTQSGLVMSAEVLYFVSKNIALHA